MLRRVGSLVIVLLIGFLAACGGSKPKPETLSLTGIWRDTSFILESCGVKGSYGLELDLKQTDSSVSGTTTLTLWQGNEATDFLGTLSGKFGAATLASVMTYPASNGSLPLSFVMSLQYDKGMLIGTMVSESFTCANGSQGVLKSNLKLITTDATPVAPDALEPNNLPSQAKPVRNGETLKDLTLGKGDVDWYTFTVAENSQATAVLELLTEFPVAMTVFDESELVGVYSSQAPGGELQAQTNTLDVTVAMTPGKYYIAVSEADDTDFKGNHTANGKYELSLSTRGVPLDENEFNNSPETATEITLDYSAELSLYKGDRDWFKFTLAEAREVTVDISGSQEEFIYELYKEDGVTRLFYHYQSAFLQETETLPAGTYYLRAYNSFGDIAYSLNVVAKPLPDNAFEPNGTRETATPITLNFKGTTYLAGIDDVDWFTFTLPVERLVTFTFTDRSFYRLQLISEQDGDLLLDYGSEPVVKYLAAGKYYLSFVSDESGPLTIDVSSQPLSDADLEPNNSFNLASAVTLPLERMGYMHPGDEDWLSFTLTEERVVNYYVIVPPGYGGLSATVFDDQGRNVADFAIATNPEQKPSATLLKAGTYRIKLVGERWFDYTLTVQSEVNPDSNYEPNNSVATAHPISLGFSDNHLNVINPNLLTSADEDFFRLELAETTQLKIGFSLTTFRGSAYGELLDGVGSYLQDFQNSEPVLPAGTYYFHIRSAATGSVLAGYSLSVAAK